MRLVSTVTITKRVAGPLAFKGASFGVSYHLNKPICSICYRLLYIS